MPQSFYRNGWDQIVTRFIAANQPFEGYWAESENRALSLVDQQLQGRKRGRLLDLGCGVGRLIPRYAGYFNEVIGLDPDPARIREAATVIGPGLENVRLLDGILEDYAGVLGTFDVVLCSHVIQHARMSAVQELLRQIHASLLPGGLLILLTAYSKRESDKFKTWRVTCADEQVVEEEITIEDFNRMLSGESSMDMLPIHAFGRESLRTLLPAYKVETIRYFHEIQRPNLLDRFVFRDTWINWAFLRGRYGMDVLLAGRKTR